MDPAQGKSTRWLISWLMAAIVCFMAGTLSAQTSDTANEIQIVEAKWGFDGHVRHKTFVPLRIVIRNKGVQQKTLLLKLSRADALNEVGESLEQELILSGETTRVVQMTPYISDPGETWSLRWGPADDELYSIKGVGADDGIAIITRRSELTQRTGFLSGMDEDEFPSSITGLDALRYLFLDREPRWPPARRKAFEEWLLKGGVVVLLNQVDGTTPEFPEISFLNTTRRATPYGQGLILRIPQTPLSITKAFLEKEILGRPMTGGDLDQRLKAYDATSKTPWWIARTDGTYAYSRDGVLTHLMDVVGTRRRWSLIYLAVLLYIGWQWRVGWRWGLMEKKPERHYAWLFGLAIGFSVLFYTMGSSGTFGADQIRSLLIARRISPGVCDVEGWGVMATSLTGDIKTIAAPGSGQLYGGAESFGQNPIVIREGRLETDLPAFTTQRFVYRTRLEMPDLPFQLLAAGPDMWQTRSARLEIDRSYPVTVYAAVVAIGDQLYEFERKNNALVPTTTFHSTTKEWLHPQNPRRATWKFSIFGKLFDWRSETEIYRDSFFDVVGNGFNVGSVVFPNTFIVPPGFARVMLFTDWPEEARLQGSFPDQSGRMLYVQDIPIGSAP